jgi:GNAT superfamily N-acetyltransferase
MSKVLAIAGVREEEVGELADFMRSQGQEAAPDALRHWYFRNPVGGAHIVVGRIEGKVVGMAAASDHIFSGPGGERLVSMPQKVLTDRAHRGKGIFGRLYRALEEGCRRRGVGFFLTVTNQVSTPIFLETFGYRRLPTPRAVLLPGWVGRLDPPIAAAWPPFPGRHPGDGTWRMLKDDAYYRWRFSGDGQAGYVRHRVARAGRYRGEIYLKRVQKRGMPLMLLLDAVPVGADDVPELLRAARILALRHRSIGLLLLERAEFATALRKIPRLGLSSRFNLLVKGLDESQTHELAGGSFELALGDLDFF